MSRNLEICAGITVVVCTRWSEGEALRMPSNIIGDCAWGCGSKLQHRPHVPSAPTKVCIDV
jgi:hypothetical protein